MDISDSTSASNSEFNEAMGNILSNSNDNEAQNSENNAETNSGETILTTANIEVNALSETLIDRNISLMIEKPSTSKNNDDVSSTNIEEHEELWLGDNTRQLVKVDTDEDFEVIVKSLETAIVETERYDIIESVITSSEVPLISSATTNSDNSLEMPGIDIGNSPSNLSDAVPDTPIMSMSLSPRLSSPTSELENPVIQHRNLQIYDEFATISEPKVESFDEQTSSLFDAMEPEIELPPENEPSLLELQEATMPTDIPEEFQQSIETPMCTFRNEEISSDPDTLNDICGSIEVRRPTVYEQINAITSNEKEEQGESSKINEEILPKINSILEEKHEIASEKNTDENALVIQEEENEIASKIVAKENEIASELITEENAITSEKVTEENVSIIEEKDEIVSKIPTEESKSVNDEENEIASEIVTEGNTSVTEDEENTLVAEKENEITSELATEQNEIESSDINKNVDNVQIEFNESINTDYEVTSTHIEDKCNINEDAEVSASAVMEEVDSTENIATIIEKPEDELNISNDVEMLEEKNQETENIKALESVENNQQQVSGEELIYKISEKEYNTNIEINTQINAKENVCSSNISEVYVEETTEIASASNSEITENIVSNTDIKLEVISTLKEGLSKEMLDEVSSSSVSTKHSLDLDENEQSPPKKVKLVREKFQKTQIEQPTQSTIAYEAKQEIIAQDIETKVSNKSEIIVEEKHLTETKETVEQIILKPETVEVKSPSKVKKLKLQRNYTLPEKSIQPIIIEKVESMPLEQLKSDQVESTSKIIKEKIITEEPVKEVKVENNDIEKNVLKTSEETSAIEVVDNSILDNIAKDCNNLIESVIKTPNDEITKPLDTDLTDKSSTVCTESSSELIDNKVEKAVNEFEPVSEIISSEDKKSAAFITENFIELPSTGCSKEININTSDAVLNSVTEGLPDKVSEKSTVIENTCNKSILSTEKEKELEIPSHLQEESIISTQISTSSNVDEITSSKSKVESEQDISQDIKEITTEIQMESFENTTDIKNKENIEISKEVIEYFKEDDISNEQVSSSNLDPEIEPFPFKIESIAGNIAMEENSNSLEHLPDIEPDTFKIDNIVANIEMEEYNKMDDIPEIEKLPVKMKGIDNTINIKDSTQSESFIDEMTTAVKLETDTCNKIIEGENIQIKETGNTDFVKEPVQSETCVDTTSTVDSIKTEITIEDKIKTEKAMETKTSCTQEKIAENYLKSKIYKQQDNCEEKVVENITSESIPKTIESIKTEKAKAIINVENLSKKKIIEVEYNKLVNTGNIDKTNSAQKAEKILPIDTQFPLLASRLQEKLQPKTKRLEDIHIAFPTITQESVNLKLREQFVNKPSTSDLPEITLTKEITSLTADHSATMESATKIKITKRKLDTPEPLMTRSITKPLSVQIDDVEGNITQRSHSSGALGHREYENIPKLVIKPIHKEGRSSPKITIKPIKPPEEIMNKSKSTEELSHSPKITIKPIVKPDPLKITITKQKTDDTHSILKIYQPEDQIQSYEQSIQKYIKSIPKNDEMQHSPRITIKPVKPTPTTSSISPKITVKSIPSPNEHVEIVHSPKITVKPIINPEESYPKVTIKPVLRPEECLKVSQLSPRQIKLKSMTFESTSGVTVEPICGTGNLLSAPKSESEMQTSPMKISVKPFAKIEEALSPKLTIKPITKTCEIVQSEDGTCNPLKLTIKPILKPEESSYQSPKITIKPIVKPDEGNQQLSDELEKPERIILKIQKTNLPSPKERIKESKKEPEIKIEAIPHDTEKNQKLDKIKLKLTKEGSHAQIIPSISTESFSLKRSLGLSESNLLEKRSKTEFGNTEILHTSDISINIVEPNAKPCPKTIMEEVTIMKIDKASGSRASLNEQQISQSKFKEMLMKIQQKSDITCTPQIDADVDYSSSSDDVKIVEVIENDPLKDPLSLQDESSSQDVMIVNEVINTNPFPNVQIINAHSLEPTNLHTPKKRGRPRKNPLEVKPEIKGEDCVEVRPKRTCRAPPGRTPFAVKERKPRGAGRGRGGSRGRGASKSPQKSPKETKTTPRGKALKEAKALAKIEAARLSQEVVIDEITIEDSTNDTPAATPIPPVEDSPKKPDVKDSETHSQMVEPDVKVTQIGEVLLKQPPPPAVYEEETRMSADNSSRAQTPARQVFTAPLAEGPEESQSSVQSTATTESSKTKKGRLEVCDPDSAVTTVEQIVEYSWGNGGPYMLQEQVAQFLGVKSFKRKYPGLKRRPVEMQERDYIREKGLVSESMCDMGLTAVPSSEILDIMYSDFQEKYEEYRKCLRDKQAKEISNKQKAVSLATSQEKNKIDFKERAIRSAANWNVNFNKARKESRKCCMDLQTFTINYPAGKIKVPHKIPVGHYPLALVPGQYTDFYKSYNSNELHYLPLNTVRYGPVLPNQPCDPSQSDGSQSDTDSSSGSDSDSSDDSMSTEEETPVVICKQAEVHLTQLITTPKSKVH